MQIHEAEKMPFHAESKGAFTTTAIYSLPPKKEEGLPGIVGLFRRVSREGRNGIEAPPGNVVALVPQGTRNGKPTRVLGELQRWNAGEEIINKALVFPPSVEKPF